MSGVRTALLVLGVASGYWLMARADMHAVRPDPAKGFRLDVGVAGDERFLGVGWSRPEGQDTNRFRWIKSLEADVIFTMDEPADADIRITAAPCSFIVAQLGTQIPCVYA